MTPSRIRGELGDVTRSKLAAPLPQGRPPQRRAISSPCETAGHSALRRLRGSAAVFTMASLAVHEADPGVHDGHLLQASGDLDHKREVVKSYYGARRHTSENYRTDTPAFAICHPF